MLKKHGFVRVGASVPELKVANVDFNVNEIIKEINKAYKKGVQIVTFPELSITGYTCGDLFHQDALLEGAINGLNTILKETSNLDIMVILGMPIRLDNQLFNVAIVINKGNILGIIPKTYIPNYNEYYEKRWFASSIQNISDEIEILNQKVLFGSNILFVDKEDKDICFGIEICEDVWTLFPPSNNHALNGATIIFNLSASNEIIGKYEYRKNLIKNQSAKCIAGYVYSSAGIGESSTDILFSGHAMITENGNLLEETKRFDFNSNLIIADIDIKRIMNDRYKNTSFMGIMNDIKHRRKFIDIIDSNKKLLRNYEPYPFVPSNELKRNERCQEIFNIQACALAKRLKHTNINKTVIGISGGLDSTLAFLIIVEAYKKLKISNDNIIAITMPGFGTTGRTYNNAVNLIKSYGATLKEINIKDACIQHFKDIEQDINNYDITYENAQARERTQILMDIANKENALVIGTGDLSELALGWCTYNGDQMSMYAVNNSIPKTLVRYLVKWIADTTNDQKSNKYIYDILDTPISPELLPPDEAGNIIQKTEDSVGPYVLHDFFLYHFLRYGAKPNKILLLAKNTFNKDYKEEDIKYWLKYFIKRFFNQQFKRSCMPDGPKVGTISLSPRGDLRMPSDADYNLWLKDLD
jgi:NAD+ synthase (glutamine-hydrolysing)